MTRAELMNHINAELDGALSGCTSENPLEAWVRFIDRLDCRVRRRIGDKLERDGRNRYTGEKQT